MAGALQPKAEELDRYSEGYLAGYKAGISDMKEIDKAKVETNRGQVMADGGVQEGQD